MRGFPGSRWAVTQERGLGKDRAVRMGAWEGAKKGPWGDLKEMV